MEKINSKCQNCGGELYYNPQKKCISCRYCETTFFLPKKTSNAYIVRQFDGNFHPNQLNQGLTAYQCKTCKNVYYMSSEEKSKKCPNCGNNDAEIINDEGYCADGIIPFEISKEEASQKMYNFLKTKSKVPTVLVKMAKQQKLMGVFVPVVNYSFNMSSSYSATITELKRDNSGSYYGVKLPIFNNKLSHIKSLDKCLSDVETDDLLPLFDEKDYAKIIPYMPEYTFGYRVDSVNKDVNDTYFETISRAQKVEEEKIKKELFNKHKEVSAINVQSSPSDIFFNFVYVPVYINTYQYKNKTYKTYISGTTGKVAGKTPVSFLKVLKTILKGIGVVAIIALLAYLLS